MLNIGITGYDLLQLCSADLHSVDTLLYRNIYPGIKNFDQCIEWYNQWVTANNYGKFYTVDELDSLAQTEEVRLGAPVLSTNLIN